MGLLNRLHCPASHDNIPFYSWKYCNWHARGLILIFFSNKSNFALVILDKLDVFEYFS